MSSTGRQTKRQAFDYYRTPKEHIRGFMDVLMRDLTEKKDPLMNPVRVLYTVDPCAGGDAHHGMAYPEVLAEYGGKFLVNTYDIRPDSRARHKTDYLNANVTDSQGCAPDLIITNPPFSHAQKIVEKALLDVAEGGLVVMLLRLNFLGTQDRKPFFAAHNPERIYVHSSRMCFLPEGVFDPKTGKMKKGTDSIEYAHFVWRKHSNPEFAMLKVIDSKKTENA